MKNKQFEKISFWQILEKASIQIPIIQRDYAQGRENQEKVRNKFLNALYDAVVKQPIELDFVYGSEKKNILQPLDGQQRLTTLFLLHWYVATKEAQLDDEVKKRLKKFTYETRSSSREFCQDLVEKGAGCSGATALSTCIKDTAWFVAAWEKDPTISAMLIMLDAIQKKFQDTANLWEALTDAQNPSITFLYVKLDNFGLSDDLYIKMNARGKPLSDFENFKSQFEKHIETHQFELAITDPQQTFAHKIDTIWTDLLWQEIDKEALIDNNNNHLIDNKFIQFIAAIAVNYYAEKQTMLQDKAEDQRVKVELEKKKEKNITDALIKKTRLEQRITLLVDHPNEVTPEDFHTKEGFDYLKNSLDQYAKKIKESAFYISTLKADINFWKHCDETFFKDIIKRIDVTYSKRILFFAQTTYLLKNDAFNQDHFNDWMRIVRNIVQNSDSDLATFMSAIHLIAELAQGSHAIYTYLNAHKVTSNFASERVKEEIAKANLIVANGAYKQVIHNIEDTDFCKGKIDFALYCIDYDIDKNSNISTFNKEKLNTLCEVLKGFNLTTLLTDDFKRAFLTVQLNDYYNIWNPWSYSFDCNKGLLCSTYQDIKNNFTDKKDLVNKKDSIHRKQAREYLKELLNKRMENDFCEIWHNYNIPGGMPKWKERLIKENLLKGATYILIPPDNSHCKLAWQPRPTREEQVEKIE